jgi:hypothetical protein
LTPIKENDLALVPGRMFADHALVRIVRVDYVDDKPVTYWIRSLNASSDSEPAAISARQVVQVFSGVL